MATKILRDIGKKHSLTISLKDGETPRPIRKKVSAIDLASARKRPAVLTKSAQAPRFDIAPRQEQRQQIFFFQIDPEKDYRLDRVNEVMRVAAAGILILFAINAVNIIQRGNFIKDSVIASASSGYESLMKATDDTVANRYGAAETNYDSATANFNLALQNLAFLQSNSKNFFAREKTIDSIENLLKAANYMASAGKNFARGIDSLSRLPDLFIAYNNQSVGDAVNSAIPRDSLTEKLKHDLAFIQQAHEQTKQADMNLALVSKEVLPPQYTASFDSARAKVQKLLDLLEKLEKKIPAILTLLGDRYPHRYLVLLQNDAEARPTGGFIGSFLIIDINDGYLTKIDFNDVYDFDGQLQEDIPAPEDISSISKNWRMRDANYSPDYAISAEKAAWFLQKEKGPSVDTVIAINQSVIADLLDVTGPITLTGLKAPLDRNNYAVVLSYIIEGKLNGADKPKQILNDFISAFRQKLFSSGNWEKTIKVLFNASKKKSLLFYSRDEEVQSVFDDLGLSGRVIQTAPGEDYLNVTVTSIGGNKSDLFIRQAIKHNTLVNNTGLLMDEVSIKRKHMWTDAALDEVRSQLKRAGFSDMQDWLIDLLGRGTNKVLVKIYAPRGSVLLDAAGIEKNKIKTRVDDEIGKTFFMYEMDVAAGTEKEVTITYQLPQNLQLYPVDTYKLYIQRQPSIYASTFLKQVFFKPGLRGYKQYPDSFRQLGNGTLYYADSLDRDLYLSAVVGQ